MSQPIDELLNHAPCGFLSFNDKGLITVINFTLSELLGYVPDDLSGKSLDVILPIASRIFFQTHFFPILKLHGIVEEVYFSLRAKDENEIPMLINAKRRRQGEGFVNDCAFIPIRQRIQFEDEILKSKKLAEAANFAQKQAEAALRQQYDRAILLKEVTQIIRQSIDLSAIFELTAQEVCQSMRADRVGIFKFDPDSNFNNGEFVSEYVVEGFDSVIEIKIRDHCFGEKYTPFYLEGRCQVVADINNAGLTECHRDILQRYQIIANLVVPIIQLEDLWGLLCIHQCSAPRHWQKSEIEFVRQIANQLEVAIKQASLFEQLQQELRDRQREAAAKHLLLAELEASEARYRSVISSMTEGVVLQQSDGRITACNQSAEKILGLSAEQMQGLKSVDFERSTIREDGSPFPATEHPAMVTLNTGLPQNNVIMGIVQENSPTKWISINSQPLCHSDRTIPYAVVVSFADITEQRLAKEILKKESEQERVRALTDSLTQVANRRCFDERLQLEWQRSLREQRSLSLILLDIDYFKRYNDCYGHQAGDTCLIEVAQTAANQLKRPADLFARYGGEEFAMILPNTDMTGALAVAELVLQAIHNLKMPHAASKISQNITVSLGIACQVPSLEQSLEDIVAIADQNLYQAKGLGRDRFYPPKSISI